MAADLEKGPLTPPASSPRRRKRSWPDVALHKRRLTKPIIAILAILALLYYLLPSQCSMRDGRVTCAGDEVSSGGCSGRWGWWEEGKTDDGREAVEEESEASDMADGAGSRKDKEQWDEWIRLIETGKLKVVESEGLGMALDAQHKGEDFIKLFAEHLKTDLKHLNSASSKTSQQPQSSFLTSLLALTLHPAPNTHCSSRSSSPLSTRSRYTHLQNTTNRYVIALNLHDSDTVSPNTLTQLTRLIHYLGPHRIFLSIFESNSKDGTSKVLRLYEAFLTALNVPHKIDTGRSPPVIQENRIVRLAKIRNAALQPLFDERTTTFHPPTYTRILFLNDVLFCAEDTLELLHQSLIQESDITCGLDYDWPTKEKLAGMGPGFYDRWVARNVDGKAFVKYPPEGFVGDWVEPFLQTPVEGQLNPSAPTPNDKPVRFRAASPDSTECPASECSLLCNDFQSLGYNRVLIVPDVRLAYEWSVYDEVVKRTKGGGKLGWKVDGVQFKDQERLREGEKVEWVEPSEQVMCLGLKGLGRDPDRPWVQQSVPNGVRPRSEV
ncbi:capsular associated protein [Rhizophlyctis rosea]|nr:capsular associated protein [Rhizophlyctis rosea]